ncbi:hypothetical protein BDR22DRAFT_556465 [Usnea florida]
MAPKWVFLATADFVSQYTWRGIGPWRDARATEQESLYGSTPATMRNIDALSILTRQKPSVPVSLPPPSPVGRGELAKNWNQPIPTRTAICSVKRKRPFFSHGPDLRGSTRSRTNVLIHSSQSNQCKPKPDGPPTESAFPLSPTLLHSNTTSLKHAHPNPTQHPHTPSPHPPKQHSPHPHPSIPPSLPTIEIPVQSPSPNRISLPRPLPPKPLSAPPSPSLYGNYLGFALLTCCARGPPPFFFEK